MGGHSETGLITVVLGGVVIMLAVVSVALRFWVRVFTKAGLRADDWMMLASVVLTLVTIALLVWDNSIDSSGAWVLDNEDPREHIQPKTWAYKTVTWSIAILYFAVVSTTKLGILLMYDRLFMAKARFRMQIRALLGVVVAFWVGCTAASLCNFVPNLIDLNWCRGRSGALRTFGCFDYNLLWVAAGAIEVALDMAILALPVQVIVGLQMSARQKATLSAMFLMGGLVVVTGLVKTVLGYVPGSGFPSYARTEIWSTVHVGAAIVSACLPIFKPLVVRVGAALGVGGAAAARWLPSLVVTLRNKSSGGAGSGGFHWRKPSQESV